MMPATEMSRPHRSGLWLAIAYLWLLLVSGAAVVLGIELSRLAERTQASARGGEVQALAERATELEQQVATLASRPVSITRADFDAARHGLAQRLNQFQQALEARAERDDVEALHVRLDELAAQLKKARPASAPAPRPRSVTPPKPAVIAPPFSPLGIELRGGERLLSLAPAGTRQLAQVRLLRAGEAFGDWRLERLDGRTAVFGVNGEERRLTVP